MRVEIRARPRRGSAGLAAKVGMKNFFRGGMVVMKVDLAQ